VIANNTPIKVMDASESYFLKAEGAPLLSPMLPKRKQMLP